jgi:hypothetical protein
VTQQGQKALRSRHHYQHRDRRQQERRNLSIAQRLNGYAQARRRLANLSLIYQEQPSIYPLQVEDTLRSLLELRRLAGAARRYLDRLEPVETQRIRPIGSITKLASVDYLLTEILLNVSQFGQVCQVISPERTRFPIEIRGAFPALLTAYDDAAAMLGARAEKVYQSRPATEPRKPGVQREEVAQ